ncbi:hypothetical protein F511_18031 [Dorcoceras hygrometricum]|uniref:Homeobox domain-containing protein n=1 Tax=Dorcoceras hygrometricum TaxID=472368 RepID=A0A2Z7C079_9LAMI|nr:hypothetical protein F511_18031 [Dorcoceras hygrometricum]
MAKRFNKHQINALNAAFEESEHLTKEKKHELVGVTGLDVEQITSRFNRERAKKRTKQKMGDLERKNDELQEQLRLSEEREAALRKREAELEAENRNLKQQLGLMDQCNSPCDPFFMFVRGLAKH